jgi:serine/threonine protein phosphatase 1
MSTRMDVMGERITFAIGDIHGCFEELRFLLAFCRKSARDIPHDFLFLGDYVDRGPASYQVIAYLIREQARSSSRLRCLPAANPCAVRPCRVNGR